MTKSELIERVGARNPEVAYDDARSAIDVLLGAIAAALASGNRVEIRGFGAFEVRTRLPRLSRNPTTGESVFVPRKWIPHFKMGKELRERVNALERDK